MCCNFQLPFLVLKETQTKRHSKNGMVDCRTKYCFYLFFSLLWFGYFIKICNKLKYLHNNLHIYSMFFHMLIVNLINWFIIMLNSVFFAQYSLKIGKLATLCSTFIGRKFLVTIKPWYLSHFYLK